MSASPESSRINEPALRTHPLSAASRISVLSLAVACALGATQVQAQNTTLESIVVTADRQESSLRELAASIHAVGEESLKTVQPVHINEVMSRVPGTWVSRGNGQEHLTAIRSPVLTGAGSCGAFQMSEDGIPLRAAGFCNVNQLFEANYEQAERIEVVMGPGSVLYGANAMHGAINIISEGISDELSGNVALDAGPNDYYRVRAGVSETRGRHGYRVNINGASDGGYMSESGFDQQKATLSHRYQGEEVTVTSVLSTTNLNQETAGYVQGPSAYRDSSLRRTNPNPEAFRDARALHLHSRVEWETEAGAWTVTPYYRKTDMDFLQHFLPGIPLEENGQESFGLQTMFSQQTSDRFSWMAGVDLEMTDAYLRETQDQPASGSPFLVGTLPVGKHYDFTVDAELVSPFIQGRYQLTERTQLSAGLRYERLAYDYDNRMIDGRTRDDGTACGFGGCRYTRPADRSDSFDNVSGQLGIVHDLDDSQQVFASVSRAFRAPQANELYRLQNDQVVAELDSEELIAWELGYRASRDWLSYGLSAYWMDKDNVIFQDSNRFNVSGAETRHRGVEFNAGAQLNESLTLTVAGSYARHTYESDIDGAQIEGNEMDTAPRWSGTAQLRWQLAANQNIELEWLHMGSYYTEETNSVRYGGHDLLNLRYQVDMGAWYMSARVTNLLDRKYAERADFGFGNERYFVGMPASVYLTVGTQF